MQHTIYGGPTKNPALLIKQDGAQAALAAGRTGVASLNPATDLWHSKGL